MKHSSCLAHYFFLWKIARYTCIIIISSIIIIIVIILSVWI